MFKVLTLNRSTFLLVALLAASPANAMQIKAPNIAENGSVIPVEISLDQPMTAGQHLDLLVNGDLAAQVRVVEGKLTLFSTRVKGSRNNTSIVARVIANGRELDSASRNVGVTIGDPVRAGGPSTPSEAMRVRTQTGDIKLLMDSANGFAGTLVIQDAGFRAEISGSAVISKNPYINVKGEFSDQVSASINGLTQQDVVAKSQPSPDVADSPRGVGGTVNQGATRATEASPTLDVSANHTPTLGNKSSSATPDHSLSTRLTPSDLGPCKKEIAQFHRLEIALLRSYGRGFENSEKQSASMSDLDWYVRGNAACEGTDYPCFGFYVYEDMADQLADHLPPGSAGSKSAGGYVWVVERCVARLRIAKREGGSAAAANAKGNGGRSAGLSQQQISACSDEIKRKQIESQSWGGDANDVAARLGQFQKNLFEGKCSGHPEAQAYISGANKMLGYGGSASGGNGPLPPLASAGYSGNAQSNSPSEAESAQSRQQDGIDNRGRSGDGKCTPLDQYGKACVTLIGNTKTNNDSLTFPQTAYKLKLKNSCDKVFTVGGTTLNVHHDGGDNVQETGISPGGITELVCVDNRHRQCGGFTSWYVRNCRGS